MSTYTAQIAETCSPSPSSIISSSEEHGVLGTNPLGYGLPRYGGERDGHADELAAAFSGLTVDEEGWWSHDFWAPQFRDLSLERDDLLVSGR